MAEALALKVIPSFVEGVIGSNLSNLASKELGLLVGVRGEITYLIVELQMMKAFLRSAEEKQETDSLAREWVRLVREVSLDMENCMDKFKIYLNRPPNRNFFDWLDSRFHSLFTIRFRHEIAVEIQNLKYRICHISNCRSHYGIATTTSVSSNFASAVAPRFIDHQLDALFTQEDQLVGIDEPREKLINLLIGDDLQCRVITVLGMGGLGKTTLTKKVYEDPRAGEYFERRAWSTISQLVNLNALFRDIIRQVSSHDHKEDLEEKKKDYLDKMTSKVDLINELKKLLQNKCYIIVLDDIWNIDAWDSIKHALPKNNNGSRVIVTTRIEEVANNCCIGVDGIDYVYKLQLLSKEKSMELFEKRVFGISKHCPEHLKKVANDVVMKCDGLPLTICAMAGILKSIPNHDDKQQWTKLLENLSSMLETNPRLEGMKQVLLLSYNHLPYLLKPCFLYLSTFPEDLLIKRENLIQLWVAEGLVSNQYTMSAEAVAEYYFNELVSRSLILPSEVGWNGKVKSCRIHDVMLEVLIFKSMEENMVLIHGKQSITTLIAGNMIRRLSLRRESNQIKCIPDNVDLSQVTSLSIYNYEKILALLPRFKLLRVLVFEYYKFEHRAEKGSFLRILSKLRHLRYLSLKRTYLSSYSKNLMSTFSISLSKLQNLVTLDMRGTGIKRLYSTVAKLQQLRHLLMDDSSMKLGLLKNLKDLQILVGLEINNMEEVEELGYLTQLTKLEIHVVSTSQKIYNSLCAILENFNGSLLFLSLYDSPEPSERFNLNIKNPPSLLQRLKIQANVKIPNWLGSLSNLAKLSLRVGETDGLRDNLEVVKTLPNLLVLTLEGFSRIPLQFLFSTGGFRKLKILKIDRPNEIEFQMDCMPVLQKLLFIDCRLLLLFTGIKFLPFLQEIRLVTVPKEIIEIMKLKVKEHKNDIKLTTIGIE